VTGEPLKKVQRAYRDLNLFEHCSHLMEEILHSGMVAADFLRQKLCQIEVWKELMKTVEADVRPPQISRWKLLQGVHSMLEEQHQLFDDALCEDSLKRMALYSVMASKKMLEYWQRSKERSDVYSKQLHEQHLCQLRATGRAAECKSFVMPPFQPRPVSCCTIILVRTELMARMLVEDIHNEIKAAIIIKPVPGGCDDKGQRLPEIDVYDALEEATTMSVEPHR
jgi:hypothetical protein